LPRRAGLTPVVLAAIGASVRGDPFMAPVPWLAACAGVSLAASLALLAWWPRSNRDAPRRGGDAAAGQGDRSI
jgi:hypothetical protein